MFFEICLVDFAPFLDAPQTITPDELVSRCFEIGLLRRLAERRFRIDRFSLFQKLLLVFLSRVHGLSLSYWEQYDNAIQISTASSNGLEIKTVAARCVRRSLTYVTPTPAL